jgi:hypothetical protein
VCHRSYNFPAFLLFLMSVLVLSACAAIRIVPIPSPSATTKIRVYVQPFSTVHQGKRDWGTSHEDFVKKQIRLIEQHLAQTGIYEIVSTEDVYAAIGDQSITRYRMELNDWAVAKKIGRALHADYIMIMERGTATLNKEKYFFSALINVETGAKFGVEYSVARRGIQGQMNEIIRASYRDIFMSAKNDLLATAIRKGQRIGLPVTGGTAPGPFTTPKIQQEEGQQLPRTVAPEQRSAQIRAQQPLPASESLAPAGHPAPSEQDWLKKRDVEDVLTQNEPVTEGAKLVVYDLDASEQFRTAALILSESLREEIFRLRKFILVNRENMDMILKEMALQQTGLINEKEAVRMGKGIAANQVVTGRFGFFGKTYVLQAKRIEVETFVTLGFATARFIQGHEDDAFVKMHEFATRLAEQ